MVEIVVIFIMINPGNIADYPFDFVFDKPKY